MGGLSKLEGAADLVGRLAGQAPPPWRSMVAERVAEAGRDPQHALLARHLLDNTDTSPEDWRRLNEFLKDNRLSLGDTLGSGGERVVFDAIPASGDQRYVFKVGYSPDSFDAPDIPGVVPYTSMGQEGGLAFGVQPRAEAVWSRDEPWALWERRARDVDSSLDARGWEWVDSEPGNIGLMPDGNFGVIDGAVERIRTEFAPNSRASTPEDAIRLLRLR